MNANAETLIQVKDLKNHLEKMWCSMVSQQK